MSVRARIGLVGGEGLGRALRRWLAQRRLQLAFGVAAALPCLVSAVRAVAERWTPLGDNAFIAVRAFDVLSTRSPLVGQWSSGATAVLDKTTYSPGPLLFWLLALPARLPEASALPVTMGLVNAACVVGTVALAHRRGGRPLMVGVAIAIPIMLATLPAEAHSDVWNSSVGLLPLALLVFLAWSLACGEHRLLPVTVLVASFLIQAHLTFVPPGLGLTAVGVVGLVLTHRRSARDADHRSLRRSVVVAGVVGLACWSAPLLDQAVNRPGNLLLVSRSARADAPTLGHDAGWRMVTRTVGIFPRWLSAPVDLEEARRDVSTTPGAPAVVSTVLVLAGLLGVILAGRRRRRADVVGAGTLGLVLCASVAAVAASTPLFTLSTVGYTLRWASPAGMCAWLLLGWSVATLLAHRARSARPARSRLATSTGLAAAASAGVLVAVSADPPAQPFEEVRTVAARVDAALPPDGATRVDARLRIDNLFMAVSVRDGIVWALRREGRDVLLPPAVAQGYGEDYGVGAFRQRLRVRVQEPPGPRDGRVVRLLAPDPFAGGRPRAVEVTLTVTDPASAR